MSDVQHLRRIDFARVNSVALAALPAILARCLPGGRIHAHEYVVRNPTRADRHPGSFRINIGKWADFAIGARGGDPVSLVAYLENISQVAAARVLARMLGVKIEGGAR
jgi:hypothetical protein